MHSLVVYDSKFGNAEHLARSIATALGEFGPARAAHIHETSVTQLRDVDLLIFGCPSHGPDAMSAMFEFIRRLPVEVLRAPRIACFDTRMRAPWWMRRYAAPQLARRLRKAQVEMVLPPEGFYLQMREGPLVEGEADRAAKWGLQLAAQVRDSAPAA